MLRKIFSIFLMLLVLSGCAVSPLPASGDADVSPSPESTDGSTVPESVQSLPEESAGESDPLQKILDSMTPEEKVTQMFWVRCPAQGATQTVSDWQIGGFILFGRDFAESTPQQLRQTIGEY